MKLLLSILAVLVCTAVYASAQQNYQSQYPYPPDPYSGAPQPSGNGGYQAYSAPAGSGYSDPYSSHGSHGKLLTWGQLEANYTYNDFKGDDALEGGSGFGVDLRIDLMKILFLHFGLDRITSSDPKAKDVELNTYVAGAGAFLPIGSRFQLYGEVGLRYDSVNGDVAEITGDDLGVYMRPGVRFAITDRFELTASVLFNNTENLNDRVLEIGGYYALLSWLDVGAGVDFGSDVNSYRIGGRWRWD